MNREYERRRTSTKGMSWLCASCGRLAATVCLLQPGELDPRILALSDAEPPGIEKLNLDQHRYSIMRGPVPMTISLGGDWFDRAAEALKQRDIRSLSGIDRDLVPFWCFRCDAAYCADCWSAFPRFEDGFFDCIEGTCPSQHRQTLSD